MKNELIMKNQFEVIGYSIEYYIKGKYYGSIKVNKDFGRALGYKGRQTFTTPADIVLDNKKRIKKGTEIVTMMIQLCGKRK